jgi:ATP-binding cassette subfamily G (WHITE) protein 2 (PDR)
MAQGWNLDGIDGMCLFQLILPIDTISKGVSGAGKTVLLNVLANSPTFGVVHGEFLVNGQARNAAFQHMAGYVHQQDLQLATATVKEAITFSALLRQPKTTPYVEKIGYAEEVIKLIEMEAYADTVIGVSGES